jgi:hypothetical protein
VGILARTRKPHPEKPCPTVPFIPGILITFVPLSPFHHRAATIHKTKLVLPEDDSGAHLADLTWCAPGL